MQSKINLEECAAALVANGKGILAADESTGTIKKRFDQIGVVSTPETRRDYRALLFTSCEALQNCISGVILFEETLTQTTRDGVAFVQILRENGVLPGIKVDRGIQPLAGHPGESITEGLDGLRGRLQTYYEAGARFAKWRGVFDIFSGAPSPYCIEANAHSLARYAALCQEIGLVPIVEPEVLMDGSEATHSLETCYTVTRLVLHRVFAALFAASVHLEGIILKPNMIVPGQKAAVQASAEQVAEMTLRCLKETVPAAVPGIAFLSGGQSDLQATQHLSLMNAAGGNTLPWRLTFSYGRALQQTALRSWKGQDSCWEAAQAAFSHRAAMNSLATRGVWSLEKEEAGR